MNAIKTWLQKRESADVLRPKDLISDSIEAKVLDNGTLMIAGYDFTYEEGATLHAWLNTLYANGSSNG